MAGRDYVKAAMVLEKFVACAVDDPRRAQGLFSLAETYRTQNEMAKARTRFHKCIELNLPPYDNLARQSLAHLEIADGNRRGAREIFDQILQHVDNDLPRKLYEETLFELGNLLYEMGEHDEAAVRLLGAKRPGGFPENPRARIAARDRLGEYFTGQEGGAPRRERGRVARCAAVAAGAAGPLSRTPDRSPRHLPGSRSRSAGDVDDAKAGAGYRARDLALSPVQHRLRSGIDLDEYDQAFVEHFRACSQTRFPRALQLYVAKLCAAGDV